MAEHRSTFAVRKDGSLLEIFAVISGLEGANGSFAVCIARTAPSPP